MCDTYLNISILVIVVQIHFLIRVFLEIKEKLRVCARQCLYSSHNATISILCHVAIVVVLSLPRAVQIPQRHEVVRKGVKQLVSRVADGDMRVTCDKKPCPATFAYIPQHVFAGISGGRGCAHSEDGCSGPPRPTELPSPPSATHRQGRAWLGTSHSHASYRCMWTPHWLTAVDWK